MISTRLLLMTVGTTALEELLGWFEGWSQSEKAKANKPNKTEQSENAERSECRQPVTLSRNKALKEERPRELWVGEQSWGASALPL